MTGFLSDRWSVTQTTTWFVDPDTGNVLEQTYENEVHTVGAARSSLTLVESGATTVPADFFDTAGYRQLVH